MAIYALVQNGLVVNVIVADPGFVATTTKPGGVHEGLAAVNVTSLGDARPGPGWSIAGELELGAGELVHQVDQGGKVKGVELAQAFVRPLELKAESVEGAAGV